ncbi:uncharacterized protein GJ701_013362 [Geothlypis trichas]
MTVNLEWKIDPEMICYGTANSREYLAANSARRGAPLLAVLNPSRTNPTGRHRRGSARPGPAAEGPRSGSAAAALRNSRGSSEPVTPARPGEPSRCLRTAAATGRGNTWKRGQAPPRGTGDSVAAVPPEWDRTPRCHRPLPPPHRKKNALCRVFTKGSSTQDQGDAPPRGRSQAFPPGYNLRFGTPEQPFPRRTYFFSLPDCQRKTRPIYTTTGPSEENCTLLQDHCSNRTTPDTPGGLQPPFNGTAANTLTHRASHHILTLTVLFCITAFLFFLINVIPNPLSFAESPLNFKIIIIWRAEVYIFHFLSRHLSFQTKAYLEKVYEFWFHL